ncbi:MAG: hypothetical protein EBU27_08500, partial [Opitutae bacterium]|nr:hypothetical protein [Opitutae bacterium]
KQYGFSVNKRNLEVLLSSPKEWQAFEIHASQKVKSKIYRGRIRISVSIEQQSGKTSSLFNKDQLSSDFSEFKKLLQEYGTSIEIKGETILELLKLRNSNDSHAIPITEVDEILDGLLSDALEKLLEMKNHNVMISFRNCIWARPNPVILLIRKSFQADL